MAVCVKFITSGGDTVLAQDVACASGLQVLSQAEIQALSQNIRIDDTTDPQRIADMSALFYAFLAVLVAVWGVKQLLNLFTGDTEK